MSRQNSHIWYTQNTGPGRHKKGDSGMSSVFRAWLRLRHPQLKSFSHGLADNISLLGEINASRDWLISECDDPQALDWKKIRTDLSNVMHGIESDIPDDMWNDLENAQLKHEILETLNRIQGLRARLELEHGVELELKDDSETEGLEIITR